MTTKSIIVSPEVFSSRELQKYEEIILDNKDINELKASAFFSQFPKFLAIGGYAEITRETVLYKGIGDYMYRVDFCRRRFGEDYWDVVELKSPKAPFLVKNGMHWKFSSQIEAGIHQALNYSDFLDNDLNRYEVERRIGIKLFRPRVLLIGGRNKSSIDPLEIRRLASRYHNVDIKSYDDLYAFALDNYKTGLIAVPIVQDWDFPFPAQCNTIVMDLINEITIHLVDYPEAIKVILEEDEEYIVMRLYVHKEDLGRIIGREGKTAKAIRTLLNVVATKYDKKMVLKLIE
jgi:predicted RNA-binding protein YlqC (UPF0109 family)